MHDTSMRKGCVDNLLLYLIPCIATEGTSYTQQSYKVSDVFPFKWINKKWKEGFSVTSMTTAGSRWGIVMSRDAGFSNQVHIFSLVSGMS